ncbi:putative aromatic amino acid aminotransferase [Aspergillus candidus]|uniref:PLP-dependent transferase n=1 Tax=Aspergillus candidus TaxID=41067 RepID=A0A2I2FNV6_ASPCN|nr:PLP-dependent transferase [Aspergillus candidus]PLB42304.1 PLP-dependent transferase [Aspergillus candidus]
MPLSPPKDLSHHFSVTAKRREPSNIKDLYKYFFIPGIANLAGGLPNASYFPYDTLEAKTARPQRLPTTTTSSSSTTTTQPTNRILIPKERTTSDPQHRIDLATALQYGTAEGLPPMASFVRRFTRDHLHPHVPYADGPDTILTCGSTDGFAKAINLFSEPWVPGRDPVSRRQGVLCEEFVYMNAIQEVKPHGLNVVPVALDAQGLRPHGKGGLADVLANWDERRGRRPHLLYTITIGQNPTGSTQSIPRRQELYAICQKYDIILIEDDPYWNLQYDTNSHSPPHTSSGYPFLDSLTPSYLSLDTDGRVVRLDTFSKTIAPGCRLGWITAQPAVVERLTRITETTTQQPSGFTQAMVAELILGQQAGSTSSSSGWHMDGWVRWLEGLREGYQRRMQDMCTALEEGQHILSVDINDNAVTDTEEDNEWECIERTPMYEFSRPAGGMFVWLRVRLENHPLHGKYAEARLTRALWVMLTREPYLCLLGPGTMFAPDEAVVEKAASFFRLCFAAMPAEEVEGVTRRVTDGMKAFWQVKDLEGLEDVN